MSNITVSTTTHAVTVSGTQITVTPAVTTHTVEVGLLSTNGRIAAENITPPFESVTVSHFLTGDEAHPGWYVGATAADDWIYYNKAGADTYQDIFRIKPDGTSNTDLSALIAAANPSLPTKHWGAVEPHPGGVWIIAQGQSADYTDDDAAFPGTAFGNDLYAINTTTWAATKLTNTLTGNDYGNLHSRFSDDGTLLVWSRHYQSYVEEAGEEVLSWYNKHRLVTATFTVVGSTPSIVETEREASPYNLVCEPGDFVGNTKVIYCSNGWPGQRRSAWSLVELTISGASEGGVRFLVWSNSLWVEFGRCNADETLIAFTSTSGDDWDYNSSLRQAADVWLCDMDGNNKRRLTHFSEIGHAHYTAISGSSAYKYAAGDIEWGSNDASGNRRLIVNLQRHTKLTGAFSRYGLVMITLGDV